MPGPSPKPASQRRRRNAPARGEWKTAPAIGWRYGAIPKPPDGLKAASRTAWKTWFMAWFAAHWSPADLPGLRVLVRLYDAAQRGEHQRAGELRLWMDNYGITPAGRQARRWQPPEEPIGASAQQPGFPAAYKGLKVVE